MNPRITSGLWFSVVAMALLFQVVGYVALVAVSIFGILNDVPGPMPLVFALIAASAIGIVFSLALLNRVVWCAYENLSQRTDARRTRA